MAITRIRLKNFRCIQELDLKLPPFAAIIGPNGAGKSTLLGAFQSLRNLAEQKLAQTFSAYGGYQATIFYGTGASQIELAATVQTESSVLVYSAAMQGRAAGYYIADEALEYNPPEDPDNSARVVPLLPEDPSDRAAGLRESAGRGYLLKTKGNASFWAGSSRVKTRQEEPTAESVLPLIAGQNDAFENVVNAFRSITVWHAANVVLDRIRRPQPLEPASVPLPGGENLLSVLYTLKSEKPDCYEDLIDTLQLAFPELEYLELPLAGKGFASLNWFQKGKPRPLDAQQLSDGSLRMLWLVTLLYTVPDDGFVLIDEPEISLHPQWLQLLASLMRKMSSRVQILVATHSDQFIRWLEPHELLIADIEDGVSRFRWGHEMKLDEWLKDYTLDRLWLMGEIGGRR